MPTPIYGASACLSWVNSELPEAYYKIHIALDSGKILKTKLKVQDSGMIHIVFGIFLYALHVPFGNISGIIFVHSIVMWKKFNSLL